MTKQPLQMYGRNPGAKGELFWNNSPMLQAKIAFVMVWSQQLLAFYSWIRASQNHILVGQCHYLVHFIYKPDPALKHPSRLHLKPPYTQ